MSQMRRQAVHGTGRMRGVVTGMLALVLCSSPVFAAEEDPRYAAVKGLGELNGVALQCKYIDQVRRMKAAVVANVPKDRSFGLAFDMATNDAFLAFIRDDASCPSHAVLEHRVGRQIDEIKAAFAAP